MTDRDVTKPATRPADTTDGGRLCPWSVKRGDRECMLAQRDAMRKQYKNRIQELEAFVAAFDAWQTALSGPFHDGTGGILTTLEAMLRAREELDG